MLTLKVEGKHINIELLSQEIIEYEFELEVPNSKYARGMDDSSLIIKGNVNYTLEHSPGAMEAIRAWSKREFKNDGGYYNLVKVAHIHRGEEVRSITFQNAYIIEYFEDYDVPSGQGDFTIILKQKLDKKEGIIVAPFSKIFQKPKQPRPTDMLVSNIMTGLLPSHMDINEGGSSTGNPILDYILTPEQRAKLLTANRRSRKLLNDDQISWLEMQPNHMRDGVDGLEEQILEITRAFQSSLTTEQVRQLNFSTSGVLEPLTNVQRLQLLQHLDANNGTFRDHNFLREIGVNPSDFARSLNHTATVIETEYRMVRQGTNLWEQTVLTMNQRAREQAAFVMGLAGMGMMAGGNRNSKGQGQQRPSSLPPRQTITSNKGKVIDITPSQNHTTLPNGHNPGVRGTPNSSVDILDSQGNLVTRRWLIAKDKHLET